MLLNVRLVGLILIMLFAPISTTSAAVGGSAKSKAQSIVGPRAYNKGFDAGYRSGYARGYRQAATSPKPAPTLLPTEMFGIEVYGANSCYQYNDRDWDLEKIC